MGLFDGIQTPVEEITTGFGLPNGVHEVVVVDIKKHTHNDIEYVLTEFAVTEGNLNGKKHTEWTTLPKEGNQHVNIHASVLKGWLLSLGVPESELGKFNPDEQDDKDAVVGLEGTLKLVPNKKNPDFQNASFKITNDGRESGASDTVLTPKEGESEFDPSAFA